MSKTKNMSQMVAIVWMIKIPMLQQKLLKAGLIEADESGFLSQKGDNCFNIATFLAKEFGYKPPSLTELKRIIQKGLGDKEGSSDVFFVVYKDNSITIGGPPRDPSKEEYHVVFEIDGLSFNFGPKYLKNFYKVVMRIPLHKVS